MKPRVVLLGSRATIACVGLRLLSALDVEIPLVITGIEDIGEDDWRQSLARAARNDGYRDGIDLFVVRDVHSQEMLKRVRDTSPDVILSLQWRRIIREPLISLAKSGVVNLHNAPLPLLRGCDPFSWAIHDGLDVMGVSLHRIVDEGVDSGPVFAQRFWPTTPASTAWSLYIQALREGELLMRDVLLGILCGQATSKTQESRFSSYHPMGQFRFSELQARWDLPAATVSAALRSRIFPPFQLPFFLNDGHRVEIEECEAVPGRGEASTIISLNPFIIATKLGAICLHRLVIDGKRISGAEYAHSANLRVGNDLCRHEDYERMV